LLIALNPRIKPGVHHALLVLALGLLLVNSSCHSRRRSAYSKKLSVREARSSSDSEKAALNDFDSLKGDSVLAPSSGTSDSVQPMRPSPIELKRGWLKILGRKDYLRGDLKMEGNWNITYNETQLASPVIMLLRPEQFIYISIRPALGIEMLRLILRPDSVWMISRLHKNYWCGTWTELEPALEMSLDYRWFQDALLHGHRSFIDRAVIHGLTPPNSFAQPIRFEVNLSKRTAIFEAEWGRWPSKIHQLHIQSPSGSLKIDYLKIFDAETSTLPAHMSFTLKIPRHNAILEMHWKEPKIQGVELPSVKIPKEYRKLKLAQ